MTICWYYLSLILGVRLLFTQDHEFCRPHDGPESSNFGRVEIQNGVLTLKELYKAGIFIDIKHRHFPTISALCGP